jgi:hypothetical protein
MGYQDDIAKLQAENVALQQQLAIQRLTPELARAGVAAGAVDDVLRRVQADFRIVDGRLTPLDPSLPNDIGEYLANLRASAPHLFQSTSTTKADMPPSTANNPFRRDQLNITKQAQLIRKNPALAQRLQAEAAAAGELPAALSGPVSKKFRPQR